MRVFARFVLLALFFVASVTVLAAPKQITIGFIPGESPETLRENGAEIARLLQAKIGVPVNILVSKDYSSLIEAMKKKEVDFAFFAAMSFVSAEKSAGAKVLLKKVWEGPFYYSSILVRGDSKITKLSQLKGKRFAFVDKQSASGFLYPKVHLKKEGIDTDKFFSEIVYSGNHVESVKLLQAGKVDGVAVFSNDPKGNDSAWSQFADAEKGKKPKSRALWVSSPIPNDPFCVRQDFYDANPKISHDLMFALIELDDDAKEGAKFKKLLGVSSLMFATSQQYEPVREMVKELDLKLQ